MQHPNFPIEFKPELAYFDFDQTYDLVYLGKTVIENEVDKLRTIDRPFDNLIEHLFLNKAVMFERFSPLKPALYPIDYSWELYQVVKKYADTAWFNPFGPELDRKVYTDAYLNGKGTKYEIFNDYGDGVNLAPIDSKYIIMLTLNLLINLLHHHQSVTWNVA